MKVKLTLNKNELLTVLSKSTGLDVEDATIEGMENGNVPLKKSFKQIISCDDYSCEKFYGFIAPVLPNKIGFITQTWTHSQDFIPVSFNDLNIGDRWSQFLTDDLLSCLKQLLDTGFKVYEFDSAKALCAWYVNNS